MKEFIDKNTEATPPITGTYINRANLMAIQGFQDKTTIPLPNGGYLETNSDGATLTTTFVKENGILTVTEVFSGEFTITKTTTISQNGTITEVVS